MNYEKKYKEALECIQEILNSGNDLIMLSRLKLCLQPFFPELKESEDEKMRKKCMKYLDYEYQHCCEEHKKEIERCIAWLEKQGEKKSCITEEAVPKFKAGNKVIFTNGNVEKIVSVGTHGYTFEDGDWLTHEFVEKDARLYKD